MPDKTTDAKPEKVTFVAVPLADVPEAKRGIGSNFDAEQAKALFDMTTVEGQSASDGKTYKERKDARAAAIRATRMLRKAIPTNGEGAQATMPQTRIYNKDASGKSLDGWRWVIFQVPFKARKKTEKAAPDAKETATATPTTAS